MSNIECRMPAGRNLPFDIPPLSYPTFRRRGMGLRHPHKTARSQNSQVTVEESGPMRVVLKAIGRHMAEDAKDSADKCLDYTIRIHAYRGQGLVRVRPHRPELPFFRSNFRPPPTAAVKG